MDSFHHFLPFPFPRIGDGEQQTTGSNVVKVYEVCCQIFLHLLGVVVDLLHRRVRVPGHG